MRAASFLPFLVIQLFSCGSSLEGSSKPISDDSAASARSQASLHCSLFANGTRVRLILANKTGKPVRIRLNGSVLESGADALGPATPFRFVGTYISYSRAPRTLELEPGLSVAREFEVSRSFLTESAGTVPLSVRKNRISIQTENAGDRWLEEELDCGSVGVELRAPPPSPSYSFSQMELTISQCTTSQEQVINGGHSLTNFATRPSTIAGATTWGHPDYVLWFGAYLESRGAAVRAVHQDMNFWSQPGPRVYACDCSERGVLARTNILAGRISLCTEFWSQSRHEQFVTIAHEISHASSWTADHAYGRADAQALARANPEAAVDNAENHAYFVIDKGQPRFAAALAAAL